MRNAVVIYRAPVGVARFLPACLPACLPRHSQDTNFVSGRETLLEMARRHVREGAQRVVRQEEIVAMLDRDTNYRSQAALAREILASLHASLHAMNSRLQAIEERSKS
jgi:hypothetical protein